MEGEDLAADPVAESAMAVLDGHIVLDRKYAERGHYPAINLLRSISRLESQLSPKPVLKAARSLRKDIAMYERMEDMIHMGAYEQGSNPALDSIITNMPNINDFLQQESGDVCARQDAENILLKVTQKELINPDESHQTSKQQVVSL